MSHIGHLWIPVSDLKQSVEFYTQKLGLEEIRTIATDNEDAKEFGLQESFAQLQTKDENLVIFLVEKPNANVSGKGIVAGFIVDNLSHVQSEFEKKGIQFVGDVAELDDRRVTHFQDPDQHLFQLGEMISLEERKKRAESK